MKGFGYLFKEGLKNVWHNRIMLHARPAMKLFELMQGFDAEVLLRSFKTFQRLWKG